MPDPARQLAHPSPFTLVLRTLSAALPETFGHHDGGPGTGTHFTVGGGQPVAWETPDGQTCHVSDPLALLGAALGVVEGRPGWTLTLHGPDAGLYRASVSDRGAALGLGARATAGEAAVEALRGALLEHARRTTRPMDGGQGA